MLPARAKKKTFRALADDDTPPVGAGATEDGGAVADDSRPDDKTADATATDDGAGGDVDPDDGGVAAAATPTTTGSTLRRKPSAARGRRRPAAGAMPAGSTVTATTTRTPGAGGRAGDMLYDNQPAAATAAAGVGSPQRAGDNTITAIDNNQPASLSPQHQPRPQLQPDVKSNVAVLDASGASSAGAGGAIAIGGGSPNVAGGGAAIGGGGYGDVKDPHAAGAAGGAAGAAGGIGIDLDGVKAHFYREVGGVPVRYFLRDDPIENFKVKVTLTRQIGETKSAAVPLTERAMRFFQKTREDAGGMGDATANQSIIEEHDSRALDHKSDVMEKRTIEWQQKLYSPRDMLRLTDADFDPRDTDGSSGGGSGAQMLDREYHHSIAAILKKTYKDTHFANQNQNQNPADQPPGSPPGADVKVAAPVLSEDRRDAQQRLNLAARDWTVAAPFRLFTKVHNDGFVDPMEYKRHVTTSDDPGLNPLSRQVVELPIQASTSNRSTLLAEKFQTFYICAAVDLPADPNELKSFSRQIRVGYERVLCQVRAYSHGMFVMTPGFSESKPVDKESAALNPEDVGWYTFTSPRGDRYRYRLEAPAGCLQDDVTTEEGRRDEHDKHTLRELARSMDKERVARLVTSSRDFDPSPVSNYFQWNGYAEIVKTTGFDSNDSGGSGGGSGGLIGRLLGSSGGGGLYIEYELYVPPGFMWSPRDQFRRTTAVTHTARAMHYPAGHPTALTDFSAFGQSFSVPVKPNSGAFLPASASSVQASAMSSLSSGSLFATTPTTSYTTNNSPSTPIAELKTSSISVAHFGHPINFELVGSLEQHALLAQWPTLYFAVSSVDSWDRHRVLGYGSLPLPRVAGSHVTEVSTWRPVGSLRTQLQNYYVGGSPTLRQLSSAGMPIGHHTSEHPNWLNRFGWTTETSGSIHIRLESIFTTHYQPTKSAEGELGGTSAAAAGATSESESWRRAYQLTRAASGAGLSEETKKRMATAVKRAQQQKPLKSVP